MTTAVRVLLMLVLTAGLGATPAAADSIVLGSGTSLAAENVGNTDLNLKVVAGPADSDFSAAGFAAAVATLNAGGGSNPFIVKHPAWLAPIAGTRYVSPQSGGASEGSTGAYLAKFTLPAFSSASLDLDFLVDNLLNGFLLNGNPIATPPGGFSAVTHVDVDNSLLFVLGENKLIFRAVDAGGPGGFDFKVAVNFTPVPEVPEPATLLLLGSALVGLGCVAWRKRRQK